MWKLRDIDIEYAANSIIPKGDKYKSESGWTSASPGAIDKIAANPNPEDHAVYAPNIIPTPGTNIGNAAKELFWKIPNPSMSSVLDKNYCTNELDSASLTSDVAPIWKDIENIPMKIKNVIILYFITLPPLKHIIWGYLWIWISHKHLTENKRAGSAGFEPAT